MLKEKRVLVWSYCAQLFNTASWMILMPFVLHFLNRSEATFWLVLVTFTGISQLLTFGYQPTLVRSIALLKSGVLKLEATGISTKKNQTLQVHKLGDLIHYTKLRYAIIGMQIFILYVTLGALYVISISSPEFQKNFLSSWMIFALSQGIQYYFGYVEICLKGLNKNIEFSKFIIKSRLLFIVLAVLSLFLWGQIIFLTIALLTATMISRYIGNRTISNLGIGEKHFEGSKLALLREYNLVLKTNSRQSFTVQVASLAQSRGLLILATPLFGISNTANYALTITFLVSLYGISTEAPKYLIPKLIESVAQNGGFKSKRILSSIRMQSLIFYIAGGALLIVFGSSFLSFIGSSISLLNTWEILILLVIGLLEINLNSAYLYITAHNRMDFTFSAVLSAIFVLLLAFTTEKYFGMISFILAPLVVQSVFNYWYWPLKLRNKSFWEQVKI